MAWRRARGWITAALTVASLIVPAAARADDTLRFCIAVEPNPPFTEKDAAGRWQGLEVDLRDAVCKQMTAACDWTEANFDSLIPALQAKRCDVIWSSLAITDERRKSLVFTDRYYGPPTAIAARKEVSGPAAAAGLAGKSIGAAAGSNALAYAQKHFKSAASEIKSYPSEDDMNQDLAAGRIDAGITDVITLQAFLDSDAGKICCKLLGTVAPDASVLGEGVGGGLRKEEAGLRDRLDAAIKAVRMSGEFEVITKRYFGFDIYGD